MAAVVLVVFLIGFFANVHPAGMSLIALVAAALVAMGLDIWAGDLRWPWASQRRRGPKATGDTRNSVSEIWQTILDHPKHARPLPLVLVIGRHEVGKTAAIRHLAGEREPRDHWHLESSCTLWLISDLCWVLEAQHVLDVQHPSGRITRELLAGSPSCERRGRIAGVILVENVADLRDKAQQITADLRQLVISETDAEDDDVPISIFLTRCDMLLGGDETFRALEPISRSNTIEQRQLGFWMQDDETIQSALDRFREEVGATITEFLESPTTEIGDRQEALEFTVQLFQVASTLNGWISRLTSGVHPSDPKVKLSGVFFGCGRFTSDEGRSSPFGRESKTGATRVDLVESPVSLGHDLEVEWQPFGAGFGFGRPFRKFLEITSSRRPPDWFSEVVDRHSWAPIFVGLVAFALSLGVGGPASLARRVARCAEPGLSSPSPAGPSSPSSTDPASSTCRSAVAHALEHYQGQRSGLRVIYHEPRAAFEIAHQMYVTTFRSAVGDRLAEHAAETLRSCDPRARLCERLNLYMLLTRSRPRRTASSQQRPGG
ncbi:MAG: type VI secretion protein IcmF/TssM N-terminal domain-containing protein [Polyangiales bacterium]